MQNTININKKKNWYKHINLKNLRLNMYRIGIISMGASFFLFLNMFMVAFSSPGKDILLGINWGGESLIELVFLMVSTPFVLYTLYGLKDGLKVMLQSVKEEEL
jgi:hypothetical protein